MQSKSPLGHSTPCPLQWIWLQLPTGDPQLLTPASPLPCHLFIQLGKKGICFKQCCWTLSAFLSVYLSKPPLLHNLIEVVFWGTKLDLVPYLQRRNIFKIIVICKVRTISSLLPTAHSLFLPDMKINSVCFLLLVSFSSEFSQ